MADDEVEPWGALAEALASLDKLGDDPSLNIKEQFQFGQVKPPKEFRQTPLEQSKQYLEFQQLTLDHLDGELAKGPYLQKLAGLSMVQQKVLESLALPEVEKRYANLSEDENRLYWEIRRCFAELCKAARKMLGYHKTNNPDDLTSGLQALEDAFIDLDIAQDEVVKLGKAHG